VYVARANQQKTVEELMEELKVLELIVLTRCTYQSVVCAVRIHRKIIVELQFIPQVTFAGKVVKLRMLHRGEF